MREQDKLHIRENVQAMYIFELLMGWLDRSILTPEQDAHYLAIRKREVESERIAAMQRHTERQHQTAQQTQRVPEPQVRTDQRRGIGR